MTLPADLPAFVSSGFRELKIIADWFFLILNRYFTRFYTRLVNTTHSFQSFIPGM
jgi:hypothetical protein